MVETPCSRHLCREQKETNSCDKIYRKPSVVTCSFVEQGKGDTVAELGSMTLDEIIKMQQSEAKELEEDYTVGCFKENYMVPHICPVATGRWCKGYTKCKSMENLAPEDEQVCINTECTYNTDEGIKCPAWNGCGGYTGG